MLTTHDVDEAPLSLAVRDHDGGVHSVLVARRKSGRVAISCSCAGFARDRWCGHVVDLACMRLRDCGVTDSEIDERFEEIVAGTMLESVAHEVDLARLAYERAAQALEIAPGRNASRAQLEAAARTARDLAEAAEAASDAVMRLQRRIAEEPL